MLPLGVRSWQPLVYSKVSPGCSSGWRPITPRPLTSSTWPSSLVMIQWRAINWPGTWPVLVTVIVLRDTSARIASDAGVESRVTARELSDPIDAANARQSLPVAREAMHNAARHSGARHRHV